MRLRFLVFFAALGFVAQARADMDYRCLTECKNAGNQTVSCMGRCTYQPLDKQLQGLAKPVGEAHKELVTPVPVGSQQAVRQILQKKPNLSSMVTTNHVCIQRCMRENLQYSLCEQRCMSDIDDITGRKK